MKTTANLEERDNLKDVLFKNPASKCLKMNRPLLYILLSCVLMLKQMLKPREIHEFTQDTVRLIWLPLLLQG